MANSIEFAKNYTNILDRVYQKAAVSTRLNSGQRMVRAGRNAKEIMIPRIEVSGLGDYVRNEGYKTGSINYSYETHTFGYDRAIRLFADVMEVEESGVLDCFVAAGGELQRTQVAPEGDAYTFSQIASTEGVDVKTDDFAAASAEDVLAELRAVTSSMDEHQVSTGSRILFITPTLKGMVDDFSAANPNRSNRVLERFNRIVEVLQVRFCTAIVNRKVFYRRKSSGNLGPKRDQEGRRPENLTVYTRCHLCRRGLFPEIVRCRSRPLFS